MKDIYIFIFYLSITLTGSAQQWKWTYCNQGYGSGGAVAFDGSGNLFMAGNIDLFTEKFSPTGDSLWQNFTGATDAGAHNMALGPDTSIYLVGNGYAGASSFITKCDKDGNVVWNYWNYGAQYSANRAHSVAVDSQGNCYASGIYEDSTIFGGCSFSSANPAGFVVKLSPQGSCLWTMDVNYAGYYSNVTVDKNDDLIISTQDSIIKVSNNHTQWVLPIKELNGIWAS